MPKTVSTSIASSESTRLCAPVTSIGRAGPRLLRHLRGAGRAGGHWGNRGRRPGLAHCCHRFSGSAAVRGRRPCTKKPSSPVAGRRRERARSEVDQTRRESTRTRATGELSPGPYAVSTGETAGPTIRNREVAHPGVPRPPIAFAPNALVDGPPTRRTRMTTEATVVFVVVVGLRFLLPLFIPKLPLPAILACLVLDGIDQTIFQTFGFDPPGLPELRQGDGPVLPVHRVPGLAAELDAQLGRRHLAVPLLLPDGRGHGLRDHRRAHPAAGLPEHLRVLLHRLRGRAAALGPAPVRPSLLGRHGRVPSGSSSSCPRSTGSTWPSSTSPTPGRTSPGSPRSSSAPCSSAWRCCGSSCARACCRPTGPGASRPTRCPTEMDTAAERDAWTAAHVRVLVVVDRGEGRAHRPAVDDLRAHPARARGVGPADVRRHLGLRRRQRRHLDRLRRAHRHPRGAGRRLRVRGRRQPRPGAAGPPRPRRTGARHSRPRSSSCCCSRCSSPCTTGSRRWRRCGPSTTAPTLRTAGARRA